MSYLENVRQGKLLRQVELPEWQVGLIVGTVLGDSRLFVSSDTGNASLMCTHCDKQSEYVKLLKRLFSNICIRDIRSYQDKGRWYHALQSIKHPGLGALQKMFYPNGKKIVTQEILNLLTVPGLVLWFYDDGTRNPSSNNYQLSTCSFTLEEHHLIRMHLFKKFGLKTTPIKSNNGKKIYWNLYFAKDTRHILEKYLLDYYLPCMSYKLRPELFRSPETTRETLWDQIQSEDIVRSS